jgi:2-aminoethylphosphonate-pyruvate transaminase
MNAIVTSSVILAAGMGIRMERRGKRMPKGFLRLGDRPIIEESISRLLEVGVRRIVIVTGHIAGFYHDLQARYPDVVQLVHNPYYADSGSMYSLYCASRYVREDFLLLESDLIYERQALTTLLEYPEDNVVLLSGFTKSSDEVFVQTNSGCLVAMSKDRDSLGPHVAGELVGISKISQRLYRVMLQKAVERFHTTRHMAYETDCLVAAARVIPVNCHVVEDLAWSEMDDEWQLIRARDKVYPVILQRDNQTAPIARESGQDGRRLQNLRAALSDRAGAAVLPREGTKNPQ